MTPDLRPTTPDDLEELGRFENLLIFAKSTVEGFFAGKHKSPYRGSAAEFADYKEYVAGDDLARLDWRVYGRTMNPDMMLKKLYATVIAGAEMQNCGTARI